MIYRSYMDGIWMGYGPYGWYMDDIYIYIDEIWMGYGWYNVKTQETMDVIRMICRVWSPRVSTHPMPTIPLLPWSSLCCAIHGPHVIKIRWVSVELKKATKQDNIWLPIPINTLSIFILFFCQLNTCSYWMNYQIFACMYNIYIYTYTYIYIYIYIYIIHFMKKVDC